MYEFMKSVCNGVSAFIVILTCVIVSIHLVKSLVDLSHWRSGKGTYVLITGCDSGFGHATAIELSTRKCFVFAGCLSESGVEKLQNDPAFNGLAFIMDITKQTDIENAKQLIKNQTNGEGLWALVNNAGIGGEGPIEWQTVEGMQRVMNVNLWGAVRVTKSMLPLIKQARGRVINITSICGRVTSSFTAAYSMSKYAMEAFSDGLRHEMKPWGVSVHIIEPGLFKTNILDQPRLEQNARDLWNSLPVEMKQTYGEEFFRKLVDVCGEIGKIASTNINKVVNAICHALLSSSPKSRYVVGIDANTVFMAIATLPTDIGDYLLNLLMRLPIPETAVNK